MKNNSNLEKNGSFSVLLMGDFDNTDNLFSKTFPILLDNSNIKHKYLYRYDFFIRERILFPKDFLIRYYPDILDKFINIDILILVYNNTDKTSFEYLKTFYYLYYQKLEEIDKPKSIIVIEREYTSKGEHLVSRINSNLGQELANLFNGYFGDYETDEEKLTQILAKCLENLKTINNYIDDYSSFKFKELNKEINSFILIYGDKDSQNTFLNMLLKSNCNFDYKKIKDNFYEIKYRKIVGEDNFSFKIILKLMNNEYYYDSECNILLYNMNDKNSLSSIKGLIRGLIVTNKPKFKKIYNLFSLNSGESQISEEEKINKLKEGKNLAYEIGANFSVINTNNNNLNEEIKIKFDNILEQIINCIKMSKTNSSSTEEIPNVTILDNDESEKEDFNFVEIGSCDSSSLFLKDLNEKIKNDLKSTQYCLFNICPNCYSHYNIRINDESNIIIIYCDNCKTEPKGMSLDQFIENNKKNNSKFHCPLCPKSLNYDFKTKKLSCGCEQVLLEENCRKRSLSTKITFDYVQIPIYLKDCYCDKHNNFHKYYLKYSQKGLCENCLSEQKNQKYLVKKFIQKEIDELIQEKNEALHKEKEFLNNLQKKFDECLNDLQLKFQKFFAAKIKKLILKSDLIKTLEILHNNYTIISNVKSLKFDLGENFIYKENETLENRIKNIFNYFNYEADINNIYFVKNNVIDDKMIHVNGPYNNLVKNENNINITDIWGLKNNELVCVSFNDGKAKIFDLNEIEDKNYSKCIINEFSPELGINSLFVSNNEHNIFKFNEKNKNEIIYLNGFDEIKIIQMNYNYESYNRLYTIKSKQNNLFCIEIDNNSILSLNEPNNLKLISFIKSGNKDEIKNEDKDINLSLIEQGQTVISLRKISKNIICLYISNYSELDSLRFTIIDNKKINQEYKNEEDYLNRYTINEFNMNLEKCKDENTVGKEDNFNFKEIEKNEEIFTKIFTININNSTEQDDNINIIKEYSFSKNHHLIGLLSEEKNYLLLNYIEESNSSYENLFCIFDFNNLQYIKTFKFISKWFRPKILSIWNYDKISEKKGFIIIDEDINIIQYFYDEQYVNKIYSINALKMNEKSKKIFKNIINLGKKSIIYCKNNSYYLIK